ncbi:bifunctional aspartate kinase/homoserine dehydrogenase I [Niabella yanshanensis]|uniref:Bifunctional aspartate kinase/homoserine dehydrogenase I n=1 Tax=Niabella yanshanensis TaxID=577386 RepID=A0ABZ0WC92_9BACT|nr:bifunctional aspartate kinase/homoserine dehydrogenase I [Niabella yanshanensis]WQD40289.1 bifunctional aspartate kinase/homoserine dehydrogenase I [Niabella yanshanensis]
MQVLKFGGTSVANAENINKVAAIVKKAVSKNKTVVVVSALGGVTDMLLQAANNAARGSEDYKQAITEIEKRHFDAVKSLIPVAHQSQLLSLVKTSINEIEDICNGIFLLSEITPRTKDRLASYGEWLSSQIIAEKLRFDQVDVQWKDARQLITTNSNYTQAQVNFEATQANIVDYFNSLQQSLCIVPGFIASNADGITTTIGRGGSDYTAAIIAAALNAEILEIWTDVSGMMTADPRLAANAKVIEKISYGEAMELSHFGAKVIYPPTLQPVMTRNIPVWIKNTFAPEDAGTLVLNNERSAAQSDGNIIRGISSINSLALLSLEGSGMIGIPGFSKRLFEALSNEQINVILITQSSSEHSICVAIDAGKADAAKQAIDEAFANELALQKVEPLKVETDLSIVALVGEQMRSHPGVSGKMFSALGRNGINVRAIAQGSSEKNISAVISTIDVRKAINVLHEDFFETTFKQVHLFIAGVGNVGSKLLQQIEKQLVSLQQHLKIKINVIGISNSRTMVLNEKGIALDNWEGELKQGEKASLPLFVEHVINKNLRNSVFVDITANPDVAAIYDRLLQKSISVVACNKIAASSDYANYKRLKDLAREFNCKFLFETNVGAGLPVIGTLNDLVYSGDEVLKLEAVLSGTLNFVFNNYDGSRPFSDVVRQAQEEGYTEPDPRLDLSGTDVMRKILILAREAGHEMQMEDIGNNGFLPQECMEGDVEAFYACMHRHEAHFKQLLDKADAQNCKLKFVATFNEGKASVGLQHIAPENDLYHLYGKDNVVLFYTLRYPSQPLVVKGAGAGADVTASGVFADIVRAASI